MAAPVDRTAVSGVSTPEGMITRGDLVAASALTKRFRLAWTLTHSAMVLSVGSWSLLWAQALYGPLIIPQLVLAAGFFSGLIAAAVDQRCKRNGTSVARMLPKRIPTASHFHRDFWGPALDVDADRATPVPSSPRPKAAQPNPLRTPPAAAP